MFYILIYFSRIDLPANGNNGIGVDDDENDETTENEPVSDGRFAKRPVSMFEPREGPYTNKIQQIPESRTTTSMYQMAAAGKRLDPTLPLSEEVKHRTDVVTRRIQELWTAMQDLTVKDAFVPCAERIRVAVAELAAIFPTVFHICFIFYFFYRCFFLCFLKFTGNFR